MNSDVFYEICKWNAQVQIPPECLNKGARTIVEIVQMRDPQSCVAKMFMEEPARAAVIIKTILEDFGINLLGAPLSFGAFKVGLNGRRSFDDFLDMFRPDFNDPLNLNNLEVALIETFGKNYKDDFSLNGRMGAIFEALIKRWPHIFVLNDGPRVLLFVGMPVPEIEPNSWMSYWSAGKMISNFPIKGVATKKRHDPKGWAFQILSLCEQNMVNHTKETMANYIEVNPNCMESQLFKLLLGRPHSLDSNSYYMQDIFIIIDEQSVDHYMKLLGFANIAELGARMEHVLWMCQTEVSEAIFKRICDHLTVDKAITVARTVTDLHLVAERIKKEGAEPNRIILEGLMPIEHTYKANLYVAYYDPLNFGLRL